MITVWVVRFLSGILDQSLVLVPPPWRPETLFGTYIPGLGIILSLLLLYSNEYGCTGLIHACNRAECGIQTATP